MKPLRTILQIFTAGCIVFSASTAYALPDRNNHRSSGRTENANRPAQRHDNNRNDNRSNRNNGINRHSNDAQQRNHNNFHKNDNKKDKKDINRHKNNGHENNKYTRPHNGPKPSNNGHHYGHHKGSLPQPGYRPHHNYRRPNYHPPHPNGGYWGPPHHNKHRWRCPLPPRPPRPRIYVSGIPSIGSVLGIAFGTFIDYGINSLLNNGYNVSGYADNIVYINGVNSYGYYWPEARIYYDDGLCSGAVYQYWNSAADQARFNALYRNLCATYGYPVNTAYANGMNSCSWWGGNGNGYITLQFGFNSGQYYTNLFIGN